MKTLYLDCGMGAAGDMLTAALLELIPDREEFIGRLNGLGIPKVVFSAEKASKCGITGTHITVKVDGEEETENMHSGHHEHDHGYEHDHGHDHHSDHDHGHIHDHDHEEYHRHDHDHKHVHDHEHSHDHHHEEHHEHGHHHHSGMHDIEHIVGDLPVSDKVKSDVLAVYSLIAEAESHVHGVSVEEIHFHEVGTMDAIADVTAVCMLMEEISPDQVVASDVHVGSGQVRCAHGMLPVPAPATAYILRDVPIYGGSIKGELCTPTGAALLKHFVTKFGDMPAMRTKAIGYGCGKKDFPVANCVRAMLGETDDAKDNVAELMCNLDDMTSEAIGYAEEVLFDAGALDVFTIPIQMKKSRPGILLSVLCKEEDKEKMVRLIFKHTTTLGIRERISRRYTLERSVQTVSTEFGDIRRKISSGYDVVREKYEYEDLAKIAKSRGMSLEEVRASLSDGKAE